MKSRVFDSINADRNTFCGIRSRSRRSNYFKTSYLTPKVNILLLALVYRPVKESQEETGQVAKLDRDLRLKNKLAEIRQRDPRPIPQPHFQRSF